MKPRQEIDSLAAAFQGMAAELKISQDKVLRYARSLEVLMADCASVLAQEKNALEAGAAVQIAQLNAANEELRLQSAELSRRNQEITLFSKMNDFLQTCTNEAEAYSVITETVTQLFPEDSGAVFVLSASRNMLEAAAVWGPAPPANLIFPPNECWAHRRGQVHLAAGHRQCCPHVTDRTHMYACLPLLAQGEERWASCICSTVPIWTARTRTTKTARRMRRAWPTRASWRKSSPTISALASPT